MEVSEGEYEVVMTIPCPSLPYNTPGITYVLVKIPEDQTEGMRDTHEEELFSCRKFLNYPVTAHILRHGDRGRKGRGN